MVIKGGLIMKKPIILCIMDGYGISEPKKGNCVIAAKKPNLDRIFNEYYKNDKTWRNVA